MGSFVQSTTPVRILKHIIKVTQQKGKAHRCIKKKFNMLHFDLTGQNILFHKGKISCPVSCKRDQLSSRKEY